MQIKMPLSVYMYYILSLIICITVYRKSFAYIDFQMVWLIS